jgi:methyl coenzyme M reductase beta subunit
VKRRWAAGLLAIVVIVGGALAYRTLTRNSYPGVDELVTDLRQNGVECRDLTVSPATQSEDFGGEFGFCFISDRTVNIHVYDDAERVEGHIEGNVSVRGDDPNYFTSLVHGSNWVVDSYSEQTSRMVQEAIGGEIV